MSLTPKQAAFVVAYLVDSNGKKAAIKAGYSKAGAEVAASRLLRHPKVAEALKKARGRAAAGDDPKPEAPAPKFDLATAMQHKDPRAFLLAAMNDLELEPKLRIDAAKTLMPFEYPKKGEASGKKEQGQAAAKAAAAGRYGVRQGPRLAVNNK